MDPATKKRKADENGGGGGAAPDAAVGPAPWMLTPEDVRKIMETFSPEQLLDILQHAALRHSDVLDAVRSVADKDPAQRKLFIRGLGWDTTTEGLRSLFSTYGDLEEAVVILDKATGKSKGYGFVTFRHIDGAVLALKEPSKKIDGRMTVTQLAAAGVNGPASNPAGADVSMRKIYVGNVPFDMPADRLLAHFSSYGEIEEGPLGFDKQTGKSRGFALFVYKTPEAARASLVDPMKSIDGHQMICKLAIEGKKGKPPGFSGPGQAQNPGAPEGVGGDNMGMGPPAAMPSQYMGPGGMSSFGGMGAGGFPALASQGAALPQGLNNSMQSAMGGPGLSTVGGQVPSSMGGATVGYGGGLGGPYGASQYGGPGAAGGYGGALGGGLGAGSSLYRMPSASVGMPAGGGFAEAGPGQYGLSSSAYPGAHHPQSGSSPLPRGVPSGGMYPNIPPYY